MRFPLFAIILWLSQLAFQAFAIQKSLAGVVDWHKRLIGVPREDLAPSFHRIPAINGTKTDQDVIVTVTDHNLLAVLDPVDGNIIWRQKFESEDAVIDLAVSYDTSLDNKLDVGDFFILTEGRRVQRLDRQSGQVKWTWESELAGSTLTLSKLAVTPAAVHVIGMTSSFASPTLSYISLSTEAGTALSGTSEVAQIPGSSIENPSDFVVLRDIRNPDSSVSVTWISRGTGTLQSYALSADGSGEKAQVKPRSADLKGNYDSTVGYTGLADVRLSNRGYFLALLPNDGADLIKWTPGAENKVEATFHFEQGDNVSRTSSLWGGYEGADEQQSWITRLFWSHSLQLVNVESYNIDHSEGYVHTGGTLQYKDHDHGVILNAAFRLTTHYPIIDRFSVVLTTSTGAIQLWNQEEALWTREEGLTNIKETRFVELPERKVEDVNAVLHDEGFDLPGYLARFLRRFTSGSYAQALSSTPLTPDALYRDQFGFQKLIIVATASGKLYAIDSAHGNIVWSTLLALSMSRVGELEYVGMWNARALAEAGDPVITVVAVRSRRNAIETVAYHVDAFTGRIVQNASAGMPLMPGMGGKVLFTGRPLHAFPLPIEHCKTHIRAVAVIDSSEQVHFFPFCKKIESAFANMTSQLYFAAMQNRPDVLNGYAFATAAETGALPKVYPTWQLPLQPHEHVSHRTIQQGGPIASYGRVLGDRTTLYKYLNPHLIAYSTVLDDGLNQASVNIVDSVSGSIVYQTLIENVDTGKGVPVILAENWMVFTYTEKSPTGKSGSGYRLVSVELFEGLEDEKTQSLSTSGFVENKVQAVSRSFVMTSGVKALTMTTSRYGITYKDLVYVNDKDQVAFIPRRLLDPRRPDVPSSRDKEEMLIPYDPLLATDPRRTLSHTYETNGIEAVLTSPALLESTTLLFSYGLDLFGSRITPSGTFDILSDAFNKPQLLLTIAGLTLGIVFAKPAVERKLLTSRWF
ncbi:hypothetical protein QFC19_004462 [Naganishia cerealis]|uniref:Uncharacterized protein n=1 Tax=Naganishia cerealis TaxID=610337 RepID=A0ACC2VW01_9TREE|nr:hypothetical protein QFC19_004462 [Naganishia cerealis]